MFPVGAPPSLDALPWLSKAQPASCATTPVQDMDASIGDAIRLTQQVQAAALQAGIEACRIRRERLHGATTLHGRGRAWQFNEPWRGRSWSVVDRASEGGLQGDLGGAISRCLLRRSSCYGFTARATSSRRPSGWSVTCPPRSLLHGRGLAGRLRNLDTRQ